jgi:hypothetical protein
VGQGHPRSQCQAGVTARNPDTSLRNENCPNCAECCDAQSAGELRGWAAQWRGQRWFGRTRRRVKICHLGGARKIPAAYGNRDAVAAGVLMGYASREGQVSSCRRLYRQHPQGRHPGPLGEDSCRSPRRWLPAHDAATSRTEARKRSTTGLRVRFFSVTIALEIPGKSSGSAVIG